MRSEPGAPQQDPVADAEATVDPTRDPVRPRTVNDTDRDDVEAPCAALVATLFTELGWKHEIAEVVPRQPNVLAAIEGTRDTEPTLMFKRHTNKATQGPREDRHLDPYREQTPDERQQEQNPTHIKPSPAAMTHTTRRLEGHIRIRLALTGVMAHGAMPQQARSPLLAGARIVEALACVQEWAVERFGTHPHAGSVTVTPTVLHAGDLGQLNVIPAHGVVGVDVRTVPGTDHGELIARVRKSAEEAARTAGVTVELTVVDDRPPVEIEDDHPLVAAPVAGHREEHGTAPALGAVPGTTDGTILARDAGLPTVVYGPGGKWIAHQKDEYVEVAEIGEYARVYAAAARHFLTAGAAR